MSASGTSADTRFINWVRVAIGLQPIPGTTNTRPNVVAWWDSWGPRRVHAIAKRTVRS